MRSLAVARLVPAVLFPRLFVLFRVGEEFFFGLGEGEFVATVRVGDVEEVLGVRRVGGGVDRFDAGTVDRPRRQARVVTGVVRRFAFQFLLGQRLFVVAGGEAD